MKIVMYSSIVGDKDLPRTDLPLINNFSKFTTSAMNAKAPKILSHLFVDADISIWIDGCIQQTISPEELVDLYLPDDADMALFKHPERDCIYEEAPAALGRCTSDREETGAAMMEQLWAYQAEGYPQHAGLAECNFIIRRHNVRVKAFNEAWWAQICRYSRRDQLSFPYVLRKFPDLLVSFMSGNIRRHPHFRCHEHLWF